MRNETPDRKLFKYIAENGGWDAVKVEVIETMIPEAELHSHEDTYINLEDPLCLNTRCAIFPFSAENPTPPTALPQLPLKTPEAKRAYRNAYYEAHKEELKTYRMEYYRKLKADPERYAALLKRLREARVQRIAKKKRVV